MWGKKQKQDEQREKFPILQGTLMLEQSFRALPWIQRARFLYPCISLSLCLGCPRKGAGGSLEDSFPKDG